MNCVSVTTSNDNKAFTTSIPTTTLFFPFKFDQFYFSMYVYVHSCYSRYFKSKFLLYLCKDCVEDIVFGRQCCTILNVYQYLLAIKMFLQ